MRNIFAVLATSLLLISLAQPTNLAAQDSTPTITQLAALYCNTHLTSCPFGVAPALAPIQLSNGNLYGVAELGGKGANAQGTVWQASTTGNLSVLHTFAPGKPAKYLGGKYPVISFVQGADHNLYGFTQNGGTTNDGVMYKLLPTGPFQVLRNFCTGACQDLQGPMMLGQDGNFYGAQTNGAVIFRITPAGVYSVVHTMNQTTEGLAQTIIQGKDGNFYGTGVLGTDLEGNDQGTVFKLTPEGTFSILTTFDVSVLLSGTLIQASDGNFYGAAGSTIFRMTPSGAQTTLYTLHGDDGFFALQVQQASDGNLWILSNDGGPTGGGEVFAITLEGTEIASAAFNCATTGCSPTGMIQGADGAFYGIAGAGGSAPNEVPMGAIFKINAGLPPLKN
jgi:uncharacterized repeat protein (TIGR03803 family)